MELFLLYIWLKLDSVLHVLGTMGLLLGPGLIFSGAGWIINATSGYSDEKITEVFAKWTRRLGITLAVVLTAHLVIPSSKQVAYLVGGYVALKLVNSPETEKITTILRKKANEYLDAELAPKLAK